MINPNPRLARAYAFFFRLKFSTLTVLEPLEPGLLTLFGQKSIILTTTLTLTTLTLILIYTNSLRLEPSALSDLLMLL